MKSRESRQRPASTPKRPGHGQWLSGTNGNRRSRVNYSPAPHSYLHLGAQRAALSSYTPFTLQGSGGTPPYSWSVPQSSALPAGLSLSSTGVISGTPTAGGSTTFMVQLADSGMPAQVTTQSFNLVVIPAPSVLTSTYGAQAAIPAGGSAFTVSQNMALLNPAPNGSQSINLTAPTVTAPQGAPPLTIVWSSCQNPGYNYQNPQGSSS